MEKVKTLALGAIGGAIALAIFGFTALGWTTAGTAETLANERSEAAVTAALTPICVMRAQSDPDFTVKFAAINEERSYRQRTALADTGWATLPGMESADRDLTQACLDALKDGAEAA